jgi:hypothetical protein
MKPTRSNPVIMPNRQQSEHASRKGTMSGQMRPDNAVPIFYGATGLDGSIPRTQQLRGLCLPIRWKPLQQVVAGWIKDSSSQPCPRQQRYRLSSQGARGMLLRCIKLPSKQQGLEQCQAKLLGEHLDLPLQGWP